MFLCVKWDLPVAKKHGQYPWRPFGAFQLRSKQNINNNKYKHNDFPEQHTSCISSIDSRSSFNRTMSSFSWLFSCVKLVIRAHIFCITAWIPTTNVEPSSQSFKQFGSSAESTCSIRLFSVNISDWKWWLASVWWLGDDGAIMVSAE